MKNCAFCGSRPIAPTNIKKNKSITGCCNRDCPIYGVKITVKGWDKQTISWDDDNLRNMEDFQKRYFPSEVGKICPHCHSEIKARKVTPYISGDIKRCSENYPELDLGGCIHNV